MTRRRHIIQAVNSAKENGVNSEASQQAADAAFEPVEEIAEAEFVEEYVIEEPRFGWVWPSLAIMTVFGWTALYGWAMRDQLALAPTQPPSQWVRWIIDWSVPVLLVGIVWLIAMRNSNSEARRFADTAAMLSQESEQLERRLNVVNRELSLAREFLASQSLELESLGRVASEKLSTHAAELQQLVQSNGAQVDRIGSASETALSNMTKLRDDLPVLANSARDVSNQIGNAGRTASDQLEKLVAGFERLNQFGTASENQVQALGKRVGDTLNGFEAQLSQIEGLVAGRFATLQNQASDYRGEVSKAEEVTLNALNERIALLQSETKAVSAKLREAEAGAMQQMSAAKDRLYEEVSRTIEALDKVDKKAVETARVRLQELHKEAAQFDDVLAKRDARFLEEMERRQASFETREAQATEVLSQRLADLDEAIAARREAQTTETEKLVEHSQSITAQIEQLSQLIADVAAQGEATSATLGEGLGTLDEQLASKRASLAETETQLESLTEAGIRLLEIIQSGAQHSREDLPNAIQQAAGKLEDVEQRASSLSGVMLRAGQQGQDLSDYLIKTEEKIVETDRSIQQLQERLASQSDDTLAKLQTLRSGFAQMAAEGHAFAGEARNALTEALDKLETSTKRAFDTLEDGARSKVGGLAEELSRQAVAAIEESLNAQAEETIAKLDLATQNAATTGRDVTRQLRDQLVKVNELTGNLEQRIARAHEQAEEQVNNDFARRMSLITDTLNSNAIDISGALSQDVTDTAWDSYLKGDRGIFTRRAVRLIDSGEAREIAELYQQDEIFMANVSRYIHDFEAMLRSMLSTRDGKALGVTILGSDAGKLYVALAQAIERFRS